MAGTFLWLLALSVLFGGINMKMQLLLSKLVALAFFIIAGVLGYLTYLYVIGDFSLSAFFMDTF